MSFFTKLLYWFNSLITILVPVVGVVGIVTAYEIYNSLFAHSDNKELDRVKKALNSSTQAILSFQKKLFFPFIIILFLLFFNYSFGFWSLLCFVLGVATVIFPFYFAFKAVDEAILSVLSSAHTKNKSEVFYQCFSGSALLSLILSSALVFSTGLLFYFFHSSSNIQFYLAFALGLILTTFSLYLKQAHIYALTQKQTDLESIVVKHKFSLFQLGIEHLINFSMLVVAVLIIAASATPEMLAQLTSAVIDFTAEELEKFNFLLMAVPLIISLLGVVSSIIAIKLVKNYKDEDSAGALNIASLIASGIFILFSFLLILSPVKIKVLFAVLFGALSSLAIFNFKIIQKVEKFLEKFFLSGENAEQRLFPANIAFLLIVVLFIVVTNCLCTFYGFAIACLSFFATFIINFSIQGFAILSNTSSELAIASNLSEEERDNLQQLSELAPDIGTQTRYYFNFISLLLGLVLFIAFVQVAEVEQVVISDPLIVASVLIGVMQVALFSTFIDSSYFNYLSSNKELVGSKENRELITEIAENKGLKIQLVVIFSSIIFPYLISFFLGKEALAAILFASIITLSLFSYWKQESLRYSKNPIDFNIIDYKYSLLIKFLPLIYITLSYFL